MSTPEMLSPKEPPLPPKVLLKRVGSCLAWGVAIVVGVRDSSGDDLLELVLRAGAVWLGVWVIWSIGLSVISPLISVENPVVTLTSEDETQQSENEKAKEKE